MTTISRSDIERFWSKVDRCGPDECWEWRAARNRQGYGRIFVAMRRTTAHRAAWEIENGPIPAGLFVLHSCDNPPCVNPGHLFLGTQIDNVADRERKGRTAKLSGEMNKAAKLTWEIVDAVRSEYSSGNITRRKITERYGVSLSAIDVVVDGKRWVRPRSEAR